MQQNFKQVPSQPKKKPLSSSPLSDDFHAIVGGNFCQRKHTLGDLGGPGSAMCFYLASSPPNPIMFAMVCWCLLCQNSNTSFKTYSSHYHQTFSVFLFSLGASIHSPDQPTSVAAASDSTPTGRHSRICTTILGKCENQDTKNVTSGSMEGTSLRNRWLFWFASLVSRFVLHPLDALGVCPAKVVIQTPRSRA